MVQLILDNYYEITKIYESTKNFYNEPINSFRIFVLNS